MSPARLTLLACAVAALSLPAAASAATVHLRGTAYEFNRTEVRLAGATIRAAERPSLSTTTRKDGTYDLAVPDGMRVTPFIVAEGHHTIYLQTFRMDGEDLERVNFQTPTEDVYRGLAALLEVPVDENGELAECAIVSTFSTRNVRDVSFEEFRAYGAHGVAGATAFATPELPGPIYFNENVIPDRTQERSSEDGGVIWTEVPAGVYTIRARHPSTTFAPFTATCAPGRVVNANPPWGLHELAPANPVRVRAAWSGRTLRSLTARKLAAGSTVRVRCAGCGSWTLRPKGATADLLGGRSVRLGSGGSLEVTVTTHAFDGAALSWRARGKGAPALTRRCIPIGNTRPRKRC
jgi:hypothetical protein